MARLNRIINSGKFYEIVFRARKGLPLPPRPLINSIIESILARAQRDNKVVICHMVWMGNHVHLGCIILDAHAATCFYKEVQKALTDALKRLLGLDYLKLWEEKVSVIEILDINAAVKQIAYWYANPARANLVDSIDDYPGVSSWQTFYSASTDIHYKETREIPWLRMNSIPKLKTLSPNPFSERQLTFRLLAEAKESHKLEIQPNAWFKVFGISCPTLIDNWNKQIIDRLMKFETDARNQRIDKNCKLIGVNRLLNQKIMKSYSPDRRSDRKIFVICSDSARRIAYILRYKQLVAEAKRLYNKWKSGDQSFQWPPGMFRPWGPPTASAI